MGVDFMRLSYRKSVEVRGGHKLFASTRKNSFSLGQTLRTIFPFARIPDGESINEERLLQLLRQPDLAKFTIAMAYRNALESDGIHLHFCDSARISDFN